MRFHRSALIGLACLAIGLDFNSNGVARAEIAEEDITEETSEYTYPEESKSFDFEADVSRMLDIVVNSLYQNKDIFLRELISNSQDAIDKARFLSIKNPNILDAKEELDVRIVADPVAKTITITDSGIGMTKNDLVNNLGVVANSGTSKFLDAVTDGTADVSQIGQFGVGFYSAFLVADRIRVASKYADDSVQYVWESKNGESSFHIYEDPRGNTLGRGTEITLFMKEDAVEYCDEVKIKELASYYSEFLTHPIHVAKTETIQVPVKDEDAGGETDEDDFAISDDDMDGADQEMEDVTTQTWELVNGNKPIWVRDKDDVSDSEYQDFFQVVAKDEYEKPKSWIHFNAEGNINFKSILYLPPRLTAESQIKDENGNGQKNAMKLYVKKVLISDAFELLPSYLGFIKGVVDSDDLPLNVNRETLQENKVIRIIKKKLVRKVLEMLKKFSSKKKLEEKDEDETKEVELDDEGNIIEQEAEEVEEKEDEYLKWFTEFGTALKMGVIEDSANRERLLKLLMFKSSKVEDNTETRTLQEYLDNMPEWQTQIYYLPGNDIKAIKKSEFLSTFIDKDIEVLYFDHPIDEYLTNHATEFSGISFQSITKAGVKLEDEDKDLIKRREQVYKAKFKPVNKFFKAIFGEALTRVTVSKRCGDAAALLSAEQHGMSSNMEQVMKSQSRATSIPEHSYRSHRVFEFNPRHPLIIKLNEMVTAPEDSDEDFVSDEKTIDLAWMIHDTAVLNSGYSLHDISQFTERMNRVLQSELGLDDMELEDEIEPSVEEDEISEDEEDESMDELDQSLPPGYEAGEPQILIP